jgi:HD-GYP domain-containing protein (c-di-GMP phosphodiesterase class II)
VPDTIRLAQLTGAVAQAADAGIGFPPETSLRLCLVAVALARAIGLSDEQTRDVYHAALLRHAGCTASAHEETRIAGDEIQLRSTIALGDAGNPGDMLPRLVRGIARGRALPTRVRTVATLLARAPSVLPQALRGRCEVAIRFAVRLGLGPRVERALDEAFERWDGKGLPSGRKGDEVSLAARIVSLAELAASYFAVGGVAGAREVVAARSGGHVDPDLAARFLDDADGLLADAMAPSAWERVLEVEPRPFAHVAGAQQRAIAELLADFADLKSTFTLGHSRGVAARAVQAAGALGATDEERSRVEVAALVHDIGRVAVSNALWDKPGPLGRGEMEQVRTHAYHTDRVLAAIGGAVGEAGPLASMAHERLDGSGYHRRLPGSGLSRWTRLLAAADVAQALSEARPHRPARATQDASKILRDLAKEGVLCPRAVDAVLGASSAGGASRKARVRGSHPAGLSEREVDVLRLVARGLTDKEVASKLGISFRTVHAHNKNAYGKIGVSTRAAAALFLVENDLLEG